ncbi:MAG TPA: acyl-protein synthetase [Bryobacteraceae bacterium]|nr:acyl-protein synthetase [Bryobacteraceae bacterium]
MTGFELLSETPQFSLAQPEKERLLLPLFNGLTERHAEGCAEYSRLLRVFGLASQAGMMEQIPFLPVGLFKSHALRSVPPEQVFRTMTSSGTTGQQVSQIFLDKETAMRQTAALGKIVGHVIGRERLPMILIESSALIKDRKRYSARAAGLLGMMNFGRHHFYTLDEAMELDEAGLHEFLERFGSQPFLMFGFTFMVWRYFYERLRGRGFDLSHGILLHSGGWKKLEDMAVGNDVFKQRLERETGLRRIYNFYGMVEQTGSIYVEGEDGFLYAPNFADIIVRDPVTLAPAAIGQPGIIQVLSILPLSYPGHSILTEDMGVIHGVDDSTCGRKGKRFSVNGRVPKTELRGCSDVHASQVA